MKTEIYACDICSEMKNSETDGYAYRLRISTRPNKISKICSLCRPNVVAVQE